MLVARAVIAILIGMLSVTCAKSDESHYVNFDPVRVEVGDSAGGKTTGFAINGIRAGIWSTVAPNGKVTIIRQYESIESIQDHMKETDKITQNRPAITLFDYDGQPIESDIIPNNCLPSEPDRKNDCQLRSVVMPIKPDFDPCGGCLVAVYKCPIDFSDSDDVEQIALNFLSTRGIRVNFRDAANGIFLLLTAFTTDGDVQRTYRIRGEVFGVSYWSYASTCEVTLSIERLTIPVINGKRDLQRSTSDDDDVTLSLGEQFSAFAKKLSEKAVVVGRDRPNRPSLRELFH